MTEPSADASTDDLDTDDLLAMLASEDPTVRDDIALPELAGRVESGALDSDLVGLGDRLVATLADGPVQARTFAALVLGEVVERDRATAADLVAGRDVGRWRRGFLDWWLGETDLRGWDPELGWLHAVAHGADALLAFGRSRHTDPDALPVLLGAAALRVATTREPFGAAEDDRVAYAMFGVLARGDLTAAAATAWVAPLVTRLSAVAPGPVPPSAANTVHTVTALSLMVQRGCRLPGAPDLVCVPHRTEVLDALAEVYRVPWSLLG